MKKNIISCPHCGKPVNVTLSIYQQIEEELKNQFQEKQFILDEEKKELERKKTEIDDAIQKGISTKLSSEKLKMEKRLREVISIEKEDEIKSYKEQLDEKVIEAKELNRVKADFLKLKREKEELADKITAEAEKKISENLKEQKELIRKEVEQKNQLKISEKNLLIDQLKEQLKIAQRKAEQGSVQSQGEVQELAIEDFLRSNFPFDTVEEIKKGMRGADCLQIVNTAARQNCGSIYYESKRTKDFQNSWLDKFKEDFRERNATFGVLVTEVYPKGLESFAQRDGIWICSFQEFQGLSFVLRESVILLNNAYLTQENKGGKMELLYSYLTSGEFRNQIESIVEGFSQLNVDLMKERRAMEAIWKEREKQIQKVVLNTTHMYSSIKGIAGNAVPVIKSLELPSHPNDVKL